jgi:hypothetical protein
MNKIIKIKQGDTYPPLDATFIDETKVPINLTDADVFVSMGNGMGTKKINRKPVTVIDALKGTLIMLIKNVKIVN